MKLFWCGIRLTLGRKTTKCWLKPVNICIKTALKNRAMLSPGENKPVLFHRLTLQKGKCSCFMKFGDLTWLEFYVIGCIQQLWSRFARQLRREAVTRRGSGDRILYSSTVSCIVLTHTLTHTLFQSLSSLGSSNTSPSWTSWSFRELLSSDRVSLFPSIPYLARITAQQYTAHRLFSAALINDADTSLWGETIEAAGKESCGKY